MANNIPHVGAPFMGPHITCMSSSFPAMLTLDRVVLRGRGEKWALLSDASNPKAAFTFEVRKNYVVQRLASGQALNHTHTHNSFFERK